MGKNILRCEPANCPPQKIERSTAEITAQQHHRLIRQPARDEFEPELEFVAGTPVHLPKAPPVRLAQGSSMRFAHTMRRRPRRSDAAPARALADVVTRQVAMVPVLPPVEAPEVSPLEAPEPPPVGAPELPPLEALALPPRVAGTPKRPLAPRTGRERFALPVALVLVLGAAAVFLLR